MNNAVIALLKSMRKAYGVIAETEPNLRNWKMFSNKEYANELIFRLLIADKPCMISRIGSTEMLCINNYIGVKKKSTRSIVGFIKGNSLPWWWEQSTINQMRDWSGFFPPEIEALERFSELMLNDMSEIDVLGSWLNAERLVKDHLLSADRVVLEDLEPFFCMNPWTRALKHKKVLVLHPFAEDIEAQYGNRVHLFDNEMLPEFELKTLKAVQSLGGNNDEFHDWFDALAYMKSEIDKVDYDICIIGCGAYGLPVAAHVKRSGKKAVHLGGVTQLLFGIKGKRWEEFIVWPYKNLFNSHWIRPNQSTVPQNADNVEGGCYW